MTVDFLSLLNDTNSIKNDETDEITLTFPKFEFDGTYEIRSSCKIKSNCKTVIKCHFFNIKSSMVFIEGIHFETSINLKDINNFNLSNSSISNIENGSSLVISNCKSITISHIKISNIDSFPGILVKNESVVNADNLFISELTNEFIVCESKSSFYLNESKLKNTKLCGITVSEKSHLEIRNTEISETTLPAIYINKSNCIIEHNEIKKVELNAIVLTKVKSFEISQNRITNIKGSAISVQLHSKGVIHHNIISQVESNGIYVNDHSDVEVNNNELSNIKYPGISILMKSIGTLKENKIFNISSNGISIRCASNVSIIKSDITSIDECGISISDTKTCLIEQNNISNCKIAAIEAYDGSMVNIFKNNIQFIKQYAFMVYTSAFTKVENNNISDIEIAMVKLCYKGGGEFIKNQVCNCKNQKEGQTSFRYFFEENGNFLSCTNENSRKTDSILLDDIIPENDIMCLKCGKKQRNCFLLNCGHRVYCSDCAKNELENNHNCPICRFKIISLVEKSIENGETCNFCMSNPKNCLVTPCGHISCCHNCMSQWYKLKKSCPACRIVPISYKTFYDL